MSRLLFLLRTNRAFALALGLCVALLVTWLALDRPEKAERRLEERIASGKAVPHHFYVPVYLWRGLTLNLGVAALLAGACYYAGRKSSDLPAAEVPARLSGVQRAAVVAALALAAVHGWQRLDHSTWGDEDYTVKLYIQPEVEQQEDGSLRFTERTWPDVIWHGKRTNNHFGYTALAKLCHDSFFRPGSGPRDPYFSETLVRLPAFAAGLLSVLALTWMARVWRITAGLWLLLLLWVAHPWFVRFTSDARGYSMVLLCVPLLFGIAGRILQTGGWRWWLALAAVQTFCFWSYFAVFYILIPFHAGLLWAVMTVGGNKADRSVQAARWLVANLLSALVIIQLMAPLLPQLLDFIRASGSQIAGSITPTWWQDAAAYLLTGTPWNEWSNVNPLSISLGERSGVAFVIAVVTCGLFAALLLAGIVFTARDATRRWLLLPVLGAPVLFFAHMLGSGIKPYHWYLLLYYPGCLLLAGVALQGLKPRSLMPACLLLTAVGFILASDAQRGALLRHPIEPCRESVELTRVIMNPRHPQYGSDSITAGFTMFTEAYDPGLVRFQTLDELRKLMSDAKSSNRQLYINFSSRAFCETHYPELFQLFNDPAHFELVAVLPGQFDAATREVLRAR